MSNKNKILVQITSHRNAMIGNLNRKRKLYETVGMPSNYVIRQVIYKSEFNNKSCGAKQMRVAI